MRRGWRQVGQNIVEGFARRYRGDRLKFLNTSESSLAEVGYCIHVAGRLGYITAQKVTELEKEIRAVAAPLIGLERFSNVRSVRLQADFKKSG